MDDVPKLEPHCGSWIFTSDRGEARETFDIERARRALKAGYRVETAHQYLTRINREIREQQS